MTAVASAPPAIDPAKQQAALTREAARTSRLFASMGEVATAAPAPAASGLEGALAGLTPGVAATGTQNPPIATEPPVAAPVGHKLAFLAGGAERPSVNPARLTAPVSPYLVQAGTLIDAALITGIRSDIPGQVTAQVTTDVRDTVTGRWLLIRKAPA